MVQYASIPATSSGWFRIMIRETVPNAIPTPGIVWQRVQDLVTRFCRDPSSPFAAASAYWLQNPVKPTDLKPHEVIVYLVKDRDSSLIRRHFPALWRRPGENTLGMTAVGGPRNLSEVYYDHPYHAGEPKQLANTIVHELMHNKLNMGEHMHDLAPFTGRMGGFLQENLPAQTAVERMARAEFEPTRADIAAMAPAMSKPVPQVAGV
jgi:hypothetical protein